MQQQGGMFGPTPQELQMGMMEQQQLADQQAAMQWGRQNLGQQISTGAYGSALGFGRGLQNLGQATGVLPQDPRLDEARRLMGIKKEIMDSGIDPQNIDEFYPALISKMMSGGMIDKATALQKDYQNLSNTQDAIQVRRDAAAAKKREEAMPGLKVYQSLLSQPDKYDPIEVAKFRASITPENPTGDAGLLKDAAISKPEKYDTSRETETGRILYVDKVGKEQPWYFNEKGERTLQGNMKVRDRATKVTLSSEFREAPKIVEGVMANDKANEEDLALIDDARRGKGFINEAVTGKNPNGYEGARTLLARAIGKGKLSNADIERIGVTPALVDGFKDFLNKKFVGVPTQQQLSQMYALLTLLEEDATKQVNRRTDRVRAAAGAAGWGGDPNTYFPRVTPQAPSGAPKSPTTQGKPTLRWDAAQGKLVPIGQ